jgi:hypothetical protein
MDQSPDVPLASDEELARLRDIRLHLLRLHKTLLDAERVRYEREHGRVAGPFQLLHLVTNDPAFAWLRPLSALIVEFDERMDGDEPLTAAAARVLRDEARVLTTPNEGGDQAQRNYHWALQESPEALMAHGRVMRLLGT